MTQINVKTPWGKKTFNMTEDELIAEYAEGVYCLYENEWNDGHREAMPTVDEIVEEVYKDIASGEKVEIFIDGLGFEYAFSDAVKFRGAEHIKAVIRKAVA